MDDGITIGMQQINKNKIIETTSKTGQELRVSLYQPEPHLFSSDYEVEFVKTGIKGVLPRDCMILLVGKEEYNRLILATRGI